MEWNDDRIENNDRTTRTDNKWDIILPFSYNWLSFPGYNFEYITYVISREHKKDGNCGWAQVCQTPQTHNITTNRQQ